MEEPNGSASSHDGRWLNPAAPSDKPDAEDGGMKESDAPLVSPPYWQTRARGDSLLSEVDTKRCSGPIRLRDNTEEESDLSNACWARSARIDDYVIVSGSVSKAGLGSYVVWNCTVETLNGGSFKIRRRYSEFDRLRNNLVKTFPHAGAALPEIPPKSLVHRFQPKFLEKRKIGLAHFLNCVLLNPEFTGSPVVKEFLFG
ncbi:uncharacterized protein PV09_04889 [Verruconis gallopava]|uniref:Endosomal/vacuolar adapter protein YPT35 n=1 Tax=Verruconis gallopava TaxID=253628 RepID=A0A0D1YTV0_9PEZI|nr:uncharacterized protein PV09_04889 [Verruconis gallopava]KIW04072.1 hypothetical protein PV09_04889 [Verruconis gallopava]